jgi:hypothetical protein
LYAIVLAGGYAKRLWPSHAKSTTDHSRQTVKFDRKLYSFVDVCLIG